MARSTTAKPSAVTYLDDSTAGSPSSDRQVSLPPTGNVSPIQAEDVSAAYSGTAAAGIGEVYTSSKSRSRQPSWKCQAVVVAPEPEPSQPATSQGKGKDKSKAPPAEPAYLIRANSLAGYWELNRKFLRTMTPAVAAQPPTPAAAAARSEDGQAGPAISPSAQISPDSLLGEGTKVGDRASIKKCVVGRHCNIGRGAKITGSILWDFVTVEEK